MNRFFAVSLFFIHLLVFTSCSHNKDESTLTANDVKFIQGLNILDEEEEIEMFESNGGFKGLKESGNFITNKRISSYWIEDDHQEIAAANFSDEIDSMVFTDLITKLTYASYITVYKTDGSKFKVYVDADSTRTYQFYHKALDNWEKLRTTN